MAGLSARRPAVSVRRIPYDGNINQLPTARVHHNLIEWPDGVIWLIGGLTTSASAGTFQPPDRTIFEFDRATGQFFDSGYTLPVSAGMGVFQILADGETLLVTCGFLTSATQNTDIYTLNRRTRQWTLRGTFPDGLYGANWILRPNGNVRILLGWSSTTQELNNKVREINTTTWAITDLPDGPTPGALFPCFYRGQHQLDNGRVILIGGHFSGVQAAVHIYRAEGNGGLGYFTELPALPAARRIPAVSPRAINNIIYAFAGEDVTNAATNTAFRFDMATLTWTTQAPLAVSSFGGAVYTDDQAMSYILGSGVPANKVIQAYQEV